MSAEWYDLGQRLHAAASGHVAARLTAAPLARASFPVAVRARQQGRAVTVTAAAPGQPQRTATGPAALDLLHALDVRITVGAGRTLVTDDTRTLPALLALARSAGSDGDHAAAAAHIAWWWDRADFPGSGAVAPLPALCRTRWTTGARPEAEARPATWRRWLGITDETCAGMLAVLDRLQDESPLTLLDWLGRDDSEAWDRARQDHISHRDWRLPDTAARAAIGLRSRCDMADLYAAALLTDPLYRRRAVHTGHVVTGTAQQIAAGRRTKLAVTCDRLDARLRVGNQVTGWYGGPGRTSAPTFHGVVSDTAVTDGALVLTLSETTSNLPPSGGAVTLHESAPAAYQVNNGRFRLMALYGTRNSWLVTGRRPPLARYDVPLDVVVAAADVPPGSTDGK